MVSRIQKSWFLFCESILKNYPWSVVRDTESSINLQPSANTQRHPLEIVQSTINAKLSFPAKKGSDIQASTLKGDETAQHSNWSGTSDGTVWAFTATSAESAYFWIRKLANNSKNVNPPSPPYEDLPGLFRNILMVTIILIRFWIHKATFSTTHQKLMVGRWTEVFGQVNPLCSETGVIKSALDRWFPWTLAHYRYRWKVGQKWESWREISQMSISFKIAHALPW